MIEAVHLIDIFFYIIKFTDPPGTGHMDVIIFTHDVSPSVSFNKTESDISVL